MRLVAWIILSLLLVLALGGCSKGEFLVRGLTLPPGVTDVTKMTYEYWGSGAPVSNPRDRKLTQTITFACPGGWDAVRQHVSTNLSALGFVDIQSQANPKFSGGQAGSSAGQLDEDWQEFYDEANATSRSQPRSYMFVKPGSKLVVSVTNMRAYLKEHQPTANGAQQEAVKAFLNDYVITIIESSQPWPKP